MTHETIAGDCAGSYTIVRTFTATDDAGNSTSATQTITVEDTTAPEFTSVPADYTAECSDELILDDASASDNCGAVSIEVSSETLAGDAAGNYTVVRTFIATDDCGNSTSATQTITVQDTTAPELSIPADYTAECSDELIMDAASASDNCGEVTIEEVSETIAGDCTGNYTITRTFTATDDAGNSTSATQTITVQDTTAPEFTSVPADYTAECSDAILDDASASDNCGAVSIEVSSETLPATLRATTRWFARSLRPTTAATAHLRRRPSRFRTHDCSQSSPSQRTTRRSALTSSSWMQLQLLTTVAR